MRQYLNPQQSLDRPEFFPYQVAETQASKMLVCGETSLIWRCTDCETNEATPSSCDVRICDKCEARRFKRVGESYIKGLAGIPLSLVTFGYGYVAYNDRRTLRSFKKTVSAVLRKSFSGAFYTLEVTSREGGFYLHAHAVVPRISLPRANFNALYRGLVESYKRSTKRYGEEKCIVWIGGRGAKSAQRMSGAAALKYAIKYIVKAPTMTQEQQVQWLFLFKNTRIAGSLGSFFRLRASTDLKRNKICNCGATMMYVWFSLWDYETLNQQFHESPLSRM